MVILLLPVSALGILCTISGRWGILDVRWRLVRAVLVALPAPALLPAVRGLLYIPVGVPASRPALSGEGIGIGIDRLLMRLLRLTR